MVTKEDSRRALFLLTEAMALINRYSDIDSPKKLDDIVHEMVTELCRLALKHIDPKTKK